MALKKPRKKNPNAAPLGCPPDPWKQYRPEYAKDLVEHMAQGDSFETFGAFLYDKYGPERLVGKNTLYNWVNENQDFANAKQHGAALGQRWWERLGKTGVAGRLQRISKETPVIKNGQPTYDAQGKLVKLIEYAPAVFAQQTYRLIMASRFGVRETKVVELSGVDGGPIRTQDMAKSPREKLKELREDLETLGLVFDEDDPDEAEL